MPLSDLSTLVGCFLVDFRAETRCAAAATGVGITTVATAMSHTMQLHRILFLVLLACSPLSVMAGGQGGLPDDYCRWEAVDYGIAEPLCGLAGDAQRGSKIASDGSRGNCLACHQLPIPDIEAYGTIGPPLAGIASRLSVPMIRLRVVDTRNINPMSIMPGFYRDPRLINRPGEKYRGRTFLTAQQVEDVIAYLATLK
jgi:sulfur-oxidizing protein SoxX